MGFRIQLFHFLTLVSWVLGGVSLAKNSANGGCIDLMCPETAMHYGLRNLVNDDTLKTDACVSCDQCADNGYSICLRHRDQSRATRTSHGGCSCSHQLPANCHTDTNIKTHPANITMQQFSTCFSDVIQRPPQPLAVNENSSVVVTIEPFWLEPYWRTLKITNLKLWYKFNVKNPENCEGEIETSTNGGHVCAASVDVDMTDSEETKTVGKVEQEDDDDNYEHSENYDQYDDELPPEVQFDRDVFYGAHQLETYYTAKVERSRILNVQSKQIYDLDYTTESDHLKFDLKPELYEEHVVQDTPLSESTTSSLTTTTISNVVEAVTDADDSATSEERGGTNFFEEEEKEQEKKESKEEEEEDVINLADVQPVTLKSQEAAKNMTSVEDEESKEEEESTSTSTTSSTTTDEAEEETSTLEDETTLTPEEKEKEETSTIELVEAEIDEDSKSSNNETSFITKITDSFDFPRVRMVFLITLASFILFILIIICLFYRDKYCCCKGKSTKSSNGYRYSSAANGPASTELNPMISRTTSGAIEETEILDNFRSVVRSATSFNPNKVEIGISVGMGKFGPIYRAMFNSYNGSVHDVNVYLLKNVNRLPDEQLNELTTLLKSNVTAGAHPNVVSLCGVTQAGPDTMLMWEPLHQPTLQGVLRESRCARFGSEPFNFASFLSSERLATMAIGCCTGLEHLLKKNVYPAHICTSNVLVAERGIVKIGGFGLADHHALNMENSPMKTRWQAPEYFKNQPMLIGESTVIWSLGVVLWEIFSLGATPFVQLRQIQTFIDSMRDSSAKLDDISYCGEAVSQLLSTCTSHTPEARGDIRTIIRRLECISADAKAQINLAYREDFPYLPIVTQLEQQVE